MTKQQTIVALVAITILSGLGYYLTQFYWRSRSILKTDYDEAENWVCEEDNIFENSKPESVIQHKIHLPDNSIYDFYSDDLKDKKWEEEGEAVYHREKSMIKVLKKTLQTSQRQYNELLRQYPRYHNLIKTSLTLPCVPLAYRESYQEQFQEVIYKALKVRQIYQKTHYTFLHGRSLSWRTFSYFTKKLIQAFRPKLKINGIDFLRAPFREHVFQNAHAFLNHYTRDTINDHRPFLKTQLIAVDALWLNQFPAESALYFFESNASTSLPCHDVYQPLLDSCFHSNIPNREFLIQSIIVKMQRICHTWQDELWTRQSFAPGELIVICIPKTIIKDPKLNPIYRAKARGIPVSTPKKAIEDITLLEKFQQDEAISDLEPTQIQYRLLASHLTPKNGVRIVGINALSKKLKQIYKKPIQKLVKEVLGIAAKQDGRYDICLKKINIDN